MKLLHTSDWHVGKTIRGRSRADEHRAVLAEITQLAATEKVDIVVVAGDLFETATPTAESEQIVYGALLGLSQTGADVVVIAGNHDNASRLRAVTPLFEAVGKVHVLTTAAAPDDGGVRTVVTGSGEKATIALLPFVSKRGIIKAAELWDNQAFENNQRYTERVTTMMSLLAERFTAETVNVLVAHTFVHGQTLGGGERRAHFIEEYAVTAQSIPVTANYVALGHVHKAQKVAAGSPTHYCGSPLQLDFGDGQTVKQINLVEMQAGSPAKVVPVPLSAGRPLHTLSGSMQELKSLAKDQPSGSENSSPWLRVQVTEPNRAGLAEEVRSLFGDSVVEVAVMAGKQRSVSKPKARLGRSPQELFTEYLASENVSDQRIVDAFNGLIDEELAKVRQESQP